MKIKVLDDTDKIDTLEESFVKSIIDELKYLDK